MDPKQRPYTPLDFNFDTENKLIVSTNSSKLILLLTKVIFIIANQKLISILVYALQKRSIIQIESTAL
jgi:hypothetical protein